MPEGVGWPPKREDLERLYLVEKLSAAKIAKVYGLKYKNPKVTESTILYQLKRNGIKRRNCAEHIRKVTDAMVDEWVRRYRAGESLKQIAAGRLSPVTVFTHLRRRGVRLRDRVEALIESVKKYQRKPFLGDDVEKAYLMGLRYGDLDVVRHGRAIRVRVSTTHPAMASLFENLFSLYGHVTHYPRESKLTGNEWNLECDLDDSFDFLLEKPSLEQVRLLAREEFKGFCSGFFDAEGSIFLHKKASGSAPEAALSNLDFKILDYIRDRLADLGIESNLVRRWQNPLRLGYELPGHIWRLQIWKFNDVADFLKLLRCRHAEKSKKKRLALRIVQPLSHADNYDVVCEWDRLADENEEERLSFIGLAADARRNLKPNDS